MFVLNLHRFHLLFKLLRVHDCLEHQLVQVVQTLDLICENLIDLVTCALLWQLQLVFEMRPDVLECNHTVFDQHRCQVEKALVNLGAIISAFRQTISSNFALFERMLDFEAHELSYLVLAAKIFDQL